MNKSNIEFYDNKGEFPNFIIIFEEDYYEITRNYKNANYCQCDSKSFCLGHKITDMPVIVYYINHVPYIARLCYVDKYSQFHIVKNNNTLISDVKQTNELSGDPILGYVFEQKSAFKLKKSDYLIEYLKDYWQPEKKHWLLTKEERVSDTLRRGRKTFDYTSDFIKNNWVYRSIYPKFYVNLNDILENSLLQYFVSIAKNWTTLPKIKTPSGDYKYSFGDGGEAALFFPVYYIDNLELSEEEKFNLFEEIEALSNVRNDWFDNKFIENILDPDLNPHLLEDEKNKSNKNLREIYQWVPTNFLIDKNSNVSIQNEIHNLPKKENLKLYESLSLVFKKMWPLFSELSFLNKNETNELQVIVKIQRIRVPSKYAYSGVWHVEGYTENIVAVGVFYCYVDSFLGGGDMEFCPKLVPDSSYMKVNDHFDMRTCSVPIQMGTAVVFSNILTHRVLEIENNSQTPGDRLFIQFFIVDPEKPIHHHDLQHPINPMSFREKSVKDAMKLKSTWGLTGVEFHGNFGDIRFIDDFRKEEFDDCLRTSDELE